MNDTKKYSPNACRNHCSIGQHSREVPGIPSLTNIYKIRSLLCLSSQFSYGPLYKIDAGTGRRDTEEYNLMLQQKRRGRVAGTEEDKVGCRSVRSHKPVVPSRSETSRPPSYFPFVPTAFLTITSFSCQCSVELNRSEIESRAALRTPAGFCGKRSKKFLENSTAPPPWTCS